MIKKIFSDVYQGLLTTQEAGKLIHIFCNSQGLNPALETPVTLLMVSEIGRIRMQLYETFLMNINWLMANLSAKAVALDSAMETFMTSIADLNEQMFVRCKEHTKNQEKDPDSYFREISCPTCGLYGKSSGGYQDFYSVEA